MPFFIPPFSLHRILPLGLVMACTSVAYAQYHIPVTNNRLQPVKITEKIVVDGNLTEDVWSRTAATDSFYNKWPVDKGKARYQTLVKTAYDNEHLYVAIKAFTNGEPVIPGLKRDNTRYWIGDGVMVIIDAMNQKAQGLLFAINAGGAQFDGIMQPNIGINWDWDTKWFSAVKKREGFYTAELAIPFRSLRFSKDQRDWGINFVRNDMGSNIFSTWTNVPLQLPGPDLGYLGTLAFQTPPADPKPKPVLIPYIAGTITRNDIDAAPAIWKTNAGLDAKIALNASLNIDLTVNPDFSQVEVDRQVTNFDRFSLFFPERRNFFLENSDLFANFGTPQIRPFFSRRIGISDNGQQVPIIGGARLTGNIGKNTRIGLLSIQTAAHKEAATRNYTVAAFEQRLWKRSAVKGIITSQQTFGANDPQKPDAAQHSNKGVGLEFNYLTADGRYYAGTKLHHSFTPTRYRDSWFGNINFGMIGRRLWIQNEWNRVDNNFITAMGFIPRQHYFDAARDTTIRLGYMNAGSQIEYRFFPKNRKTINVHSLVFNPAVWWNSTGTLNEMRTELLYKVIFANRRYLETGWIQNTVVLPFETALFSKTGNLKTGRYRFSVYRLNFFSNNRKPFSWNINVESGGYYNGTRTTIGGGLNFRKQPWGNFGVDFTKSFIRLNNIAVSPLLISPVIELAFNPNLFWTTFMQYNTQTENVNINSRFQWRFKPMSDLFIVYTDNYYTSGFARKNRALAVKLNYWLNL